ncbi:MAG: hypothetical protein QF464_22935, partial [Myxococcota bacterium]|nr:hypothetical protein [Myxococcota bacterium]
LAFIEGVPGAEQALIVVGDPLGAAGGTVGGGGVQVLRFATGVGFDPIPVATFGGESTRLQSVLGISVSGGLVSGRPMIAVGGPGSSSVGVDNGAAYVLDLSL